MPEELQGCSQKLFVLCRRVVMALVVIAVMTGTLLLENEKKLNSPHPKAVLLVENNFALNKSVEKTSIDDAPFDYLRTKQWGKQDKQAWLKYYGDLDCPENYRRRSMIAIMRTWLELADEFEIEYALMYGSLLGIVRNNDVNPWDHDMDVVISYRDIIKLEKVGWPRTNTRVMDGQTFINYIPNSQHQVPIDDRKRWDCNGKPASSHVDKCAIQEPIVRLYNMATFLDVYSYYTTNDTLEFITEGHREILRKTHYFPLRRCIFMGFDAWCPNNPDPLLKEKYGKDYLTPVKKCKNGHWV